MPAAGFIETDVLRLAASVEKASEHPLALAIVAAAAERKLALADVSAFNSPTGKGVVGTVEGRKLHLGNARFLREPDIDTAELDGEAERLRQDGATAIFVAVDGKAGGVLAIADPVKATTPDALRALAEEKIRVVMLTGDNRTTAQAVARRLGIAEVEAEVLPDQKSAVVEKLRREGRIVAMAGDGVNDAPALAAADVGIAMGTGTDVAIESAGITLLKGDLVGIVRARRLSAGDNAQHPPEPVLCLLLQCGRRADRCGSALSLLRHPAVADHCGDRHGAELGQRHRQCAAAQAARNLRRPASFPRATSRGQALRYDWPADACHGAGRSGTCCRCSKRHR